MNPCGTRSKSIPVQCPLNWLRSVSKMVVSISISMTAIWSILNPIWLMSQLESNWNICVLVEIMMNGAPNSTMSRMKWRKNAKIMMLWCISLWNQAIWNHWRSYLTKLYRNMFQYVSNKSLSPICLFFNEKSQRFGWFLR